MESWALKPCTPCLRSLCLPSSSSFPTATNFFGFSLSLCPHILLLLSHHVLCAQAESRTQCARVLGTCLRLSKRASLQKKVTLPSAAWSSVSSSSSRDLLLAGTAARHPARQEDIHFNAISQILMSKHPGAGTRMDVYMCVFMQMNPSALSPEYQQYLAM